MVKSYGTLLFTLLVVYAFGQSSGALSGVVRDEDGPVTGATVEVVDHSFGAATDEAGRFTLTNLPAGKLALRVRFIGYRDLIRTVTVEPGRTLNLDLELEPNALDLEQVVVSGTMKPTYVSDSPIKVDVITVRQLDTYIPAAASSVMDGIKLVNGVQEVVACGVCFTNSISINGLPGPYTAVLMDGTPIYGNLASVYGLNGIPNMIIDRFEVIKGPSSTLYGSEAVAGVINIITKDPAKQPLLSVDLMGTSHLESFGNLAVAPRLGRVKGYVGLNYALINGFDDDNHDGFGDRINLDRYSLFSKWTFERPSGKPFTLAAKYYYEDRRNGVEAFLRDRNYRHLRGNDSLYGESIYTNRLELFGTYALATQADLRLDYSFSHHRQDSYYGADFYGANQQVGFANFLWRQPLGRHELLTGLTARYQGYDDNTVATADAAGDNRPDRQFIPGIFVQDEWRISSPLTLLAGVRLDHYPAHGLIVAPRLNLKYQPGDWTTLRANFGTGFRVVNLFAEDHAFITGQRQVEIVGDLRPERSYNASLNLHHIFALGNSQGALDLEGYYTFFTNKIIPDYDTPGRIIYANTEGHAVTRGLGLTLTQEFVFPLRYSLGANLQRVTRTEPNDQAVLETGPVEYAPAWSGLFSANYTLKKLDLTLAYTLNLTGPMTLPEVFDLDEAGNPLPAPRPTRSRPFAFQNVQLSKRFADRLTVYGGAQNLFDYRQQLSPLSGYNDPGAPAGFSPFFDTAYAFSPIHGREVYVGVKWQVN